MDDQLTGEIVPQLYPGVSIDGASTALARLQRAMRSGALRARDGRPLDHPFYWAGLAAYGPGPGVGR